jgi:DNA-binding transcriptional MerR regulator
MRTHELMKQSGISRRALRIYEDKGLVHPARDANGYRVWPRDAVERLHHVRLLQALGLPLSRIAELLSQKSPPWRETLAMQEAWLAQSAAQANDALARVRRATAALDAGAAVETSDLLNMIADAHAQPETKMSEEFFARYYSADQREWLKQHPAGEAERKTAEKAWENVYADAERLKDGDAAGEEAQALIKRWDALVAAFTLGNAGIEASLKKLHQDRANWPSEMKRLVPQLSPEAAAFVAKAREHAKK